MAAQPLGAPGGPGRPAVPAAASAAAGAEDGGAGGPGWWAVSWSREFLELHDEAARLEEEKNASQVGLGGGGPTPSL